MEVWDDDSGHIVGASHDFVDKYTSTLDNGRIIYPDVKSSKEKTEKLCGKRSCMIVTITLYCGPNLVPRVFRLPTRGSGRRLPLVGRRKTLGTRLLWSKLFGARLPLLLCVTQ